MTKQWNGFKGDSWKNKIDVKDFIQKTIHCTKVMIVF